MKANDPGSLRLATSRYHASGLIIESGLLPLGITVGAARWLSYELAGNVAMLAPHGTDRAGTPLRKIDDERKYRKAYVARLEQFGTSAIAEVLGGFVAGHGAAGCVLLCFEDVAKPGEWCHRRMFAEWWETKTGRAVPELEPAQTSLAVAGQ